MPSVEGESGGRGCQLVHQCDSSVASKYKATVVSEDNEIGKKPFISRPNRVKTDQGCLSTPIIMECTTHSVQPFSLNILPGKVYNNSLPDSQVSKTEDQRCLNRTSTPPEP